MSTRRKGGQMELKAVTKRLRAFDDPEEIAAQFAVLGITGRRQAVFDCPVANLVQACVGDHEWDQYDVDRKFLAIRRYGQGRWKQLKTPAAGAAFIDRFDDGQYPDLERR